MAKKTDKFFGEFSDPKKTLMVGIGADILSAVIFPFIFYSVGMLAGIYGAYHSYRQKKWGLFLGNLLVIILAVFIKLSL